MTSIQTPIFPSCFLAPISYFSEIKNNPNFLLEVNDSFPKQTIRSRCYILSPNGVLRLGIPLKEFANHTKTADICINYSTLWQNNHWKAIETSYNSSAFFDYYKDELKQIFFSKPELLIDYNKILFDWLARRLKINVSYTETSEFIKPIESNNFVSAFTYKQHKPEAPDFTAKPYFQVFDDKTGFIPNLSAIDLLFNQGPEAYSYL